MMPNSTLSRFKPRCARSSNKLAHKSARSRSPISKAKTSKPSFSSLTPNTAQKLLPAHMPDNAHQKVGAVHVKKFVRLTLQRTTPPGFQFRGGPSHHARNLLGVVLMPQVLLRNPRQVSSRNSCQKSFRQESLQLRVLAFPLRQHCDSNSPLRSRGTLSSIFPKPKKLIRRGR